MKRTRLPILLATAGLCWAAAASTVASAADAAPQRREVGNLVLENVPTTPPALRETLRRYQNVRSAAFQDWLPDGSMLITTRFGQTAQLHRVAMPGGARLQLTFFDEPIAGALAIPGTLDRFVFRRDTGGDEYFQAYITGLSGAETPITEPKTRNQGFVVSADGKLLVWSRVTAGSGDYSLEAMNPDDPASRHILYAGSGAIEASDISPDGKRVLFSRSFSINASKLYELDIAGKAVHEINPSKREIAYDGGHYSADGRSILTLSDEDADYKRLVEIDLASDKRTPVSPAGLKWDVEHFELSADGRVLAYAVNEGGRSRVVVQDLRTRRALPQPVLPVGVLTALKFSPDGKRLAIGINSATSPSDVWAWDIEAGELTRWTTSEMGGLDPAAMADASLVSFKSFDGLEIPAWITRPRREGRAPVIIDIHGGPESQDRPGFKSSRQFWAKELGIATIAPNVRGSDGYGKAYLKLDNAAKRQDSVKDIGALLDWIATQPDLDPGKVVVYGGSYGGFMVLASLAAYSDRLAGAIDIVGISNFVSFLQNTEGYRRDLRRVEYGDERDAKMLKVFEKISPLNLTAQMKKPLFVVQGYNDPRVPYTEAEQIVAKVRAQGIVPADEVWYMLAKDEGHGFRKKQNVDAQREAETLFLQKVLGGTP
ncbi:MAG: S9 family peptidase [Solimonas sp.]